MLTDEQCGMGLEAFHGLYLIYKKGGVYGNSSMILKKYGRLLLTWDSVTGVTCYVLNTPEIPITAYHAHRLKESCLSGEKCCKEAFGIGDFWCSWSGMSGFPISHSCAAMKTLNYIRIICEEQPGCGHSFRCQVRGDVPPIPERVHSVLIQSILFMHASGTRRFKKALVHRVLCVFLPLSKLW